MKHRLPRGGWARLGCAASLLVASACAQSEDPGSDGQSHWLMACDEDAPCPAGLGCHCGRCTASCDEDAQCGGAPGLCRDAARLCGAGVPTPQLCTLGCVDNSDCPGGLACQGSSCSLVRGLQGELNQGGAATPDAAGGAPADGGLGSPSPAPGTRCDGGFVLQLSPTTLAERLSTAFYATSADPGFIERVVGAELGTSGAVGCFVRELLEDPGVESGLRRFYGQWLDIERTANPDPARFPEYTELVAAALREEALRFTSSVTLERAGSLSTLLTAQFGYANTHSAPIYGLSLDGSDLQVVDLTGSQRFGVFGQGFFLATRSNPALSSPTKRGLSLLEELLCIPPLPAPSGVDQVVAPDDVATTTRALYEDLHAANSTCATCHQHFDPLGFALEHFDAIGRFREDEGGFAIDTSGEVQLDDTTFTYAGPEELMLGLAASSQVRQCFSRHWLEYLLGRELGDEETTVVEQVTERAESGGELELQRVLIAGTESEPFLASE